MLIDVKNLNKSFGDRRILSEVSFYMDEHDKIGLIGNNGCGKSTLLKILAGLEEADTIDFVAKPNLKISYLEQTPIFNDTDSIYKAVAEKFMNSEDIHDYDIKAMLSKVGFNDVNRLMGTLSGGEKRRVALATTLLTPCELLMLDEPTNHLDQDIILWLESYLKKWNKGLILVTHDRYFLERVVNHIADIDRAIFKVYPGSYSAYLTLKEEEEINQRAIIERRKTFLRKEYLYISRGPQARSHKDKRRMAQYELLASLKEIPDQTIEFSSVARRLGSKIIEIKEASKAYNEKVLFEHFNYLVSKDDRIAIMGNNGAGKSTLLKAIQGLVDLDKGSIEIGSTVSFGYFSQNREILNQKQTCVQYLLDIAPILHTAEGDITASKMLENFCFDNPYLPIEKLSGGEKSRLYLVGILMRSPNVLILDEPTNDLDIRTLQILENFLDHFSGAAIMVSHDRYFLDRTCRHLFYLNHGSVIESQDSPSEFLENYFSEKPTNSIVKVKNNTHERKLSFKENQEYNHIMTRLPALSQEIKELDDFINMHYADYNLVKDKMALKEHDLKEQEELELRWLELEEIKGQ